MLCLLCLGWACAAWVIYSVSQWISQVLPSPVIAAILAPAAACLPIAYGAFAFNTLETPIWLLVIVTVIPWIATFRMTRFWMDGRMGMRFWMEHAAWLSLFVLLPAIPFLYVYATYPSMPASELKAFLSSVNSIKASTSWPEELTLLTSKEPNFQSEVAGMGGSEDMGLGGEAGEDASLAGEMGSAGGMGTLLDEVDYESPNTLPEGLTLAEERALQFQFIERQLDSASNQPLSSNGYVGTRLTSEATLARARIQDEGPDDGLLTRYRVAIRLMTRFIAGVRANPTLKAQLAADEFEVWLLREVQNKEANAMMSDEIFAAAVSQLTNRTARNMSRYRAIVFDWGKTQADIFGSSRTLTMPRTVSVPAHTLGGFDIPTERNGTRLISSRHVSTVAWHMKQYLNATDDQARAQARKALARDWNLSESDSNFSRTPSIFSSGRGIPWTYWHGDWEKQADALKASE